jgi:hypothetical protein
MGPGTGEQVAPPNVPRYGLLWSHPVHEDQAETAMADPGWHLISSNLSV